MWRWSCGQTRCSINIFSKNIKSQYPNAEWKSIRCDEQKDQKTRTHEYLAMECLSQPPFPLLHIRNLLVVPLVCIINICLDPKCSWHSWQSAFMKVSPWKRQLCPSVRDVYCYLLPFACVWCRCFKLFSFQYHTHRMSHFFPSVYIITK